MFAAAAPPERAAAATKYQEIHAVTGQAYYGDFVWGEWYFLWNEDKARTLSNGVLQSGGAPTPLTTGQAYSHGDVVIIGFDQEVTFRKIELRSAADGQIPYRFKLETSASALSTPVGVPAGAQLIGEYRGHDASGHTISVELEHPVTARSVVLQALTDGADQEPGTSPWTVSEVRLYAEATIGAPPSAPADVTAAAASGTEIVLNWTASTDDVGVTGYDIYRNGVLHASAAGTTYADQGLAAGTSYNYAVRAKDTDGNASAFGPTVSAVTAPAPVSVTGKKGIASSKYVAANNPQADFAPLSTLGVEWTYN
jgi:hypothetical protein